MRVLHLIDPGSPGGGACTLRLLAEPLERLTSVRQDVLLFGNEFQEGLARRCGVEVTGRLAPPRNEPILAGFAGRALAEVVDAYEDAGGPYDAVHAWTPASALLAAMALGEKKRVATFAVGPVNGLHVQMLAEALRHRPGPVLATSVSVKRDFIALGIDEAAIDILRPAVHPEAVEFTRREELRERWDVGPDAFVVGLLAEPMNWCDARAAAGALAVTVESGRDVRLLVHPKASRCVEARRWADSLGLADRIILEEDLAEPWRVVRGLDAALLLGDDTHAMDLRQRGSAFSVLLGGGRSLRPMSGVMPILWAMGAGVPVIAESSFAAREIIEDGRTGFLIPRRDANRAADRIVRLHDDETVGGRIGAAAKSHVHERYHVSAYCVRLKELYERIADDRAARVVAEENEPVIEKRPYSEMRR